MSARTAAAAGGRALGFVVGGLLVATAGWRNIFGLLAVLAAAVLAVTWWTVPAHPSPRAGSKGLDLPGSITAITGVLLVLGASATAAAVDTTVAVIVDARMTARG